MEGGDGDADCNGAGCDGAGRDGAGDDGAAGDGAGDDGAAGDGAAGDGDADDGDGGDADGDGAGGDGAVGDAANIDSADDDPRGELISSRVILDPEMKNQEYLMFFSYEIRKEKIEIGKEEAWLESLESFVLIEDTKHQKLLSAVGCCPESKKSEAKRFWYRIFEPKIVRE
ncbi:hypothetical protein L1987_39626 [Smallanthus sonchifolius]|uniref:Uncharacterized protein n=1 Tax=Smallanthus sonchifolius TaxID=185202 RepID=A0ACB9HMJ0_9ASTR|nr:hypothetical protein L1987_39626 [Smallanthus sonchifolius]